VRDLLRVAEWSPRFSVSQPTSSPAPAPVDNDTASASVSRFYLRGEYLLWWLKPDHAPPLATTGNVNRPGDNAGALGNADTVILQNGNLTSNPFSGARFTGGFYFDDCGCKAIELSGFFLGQRANNFQAGPSVTELITRPFFDLNNGVETVQQTNIPGQTAGMLTIRSPSQLWGLEANMVCPYCCGCDYRVDFLAGLRYLNLNESLTITENIAIQVAQGAAFPAGSFVNVVDFFGTKNQFYGAQVGVAGRYYYGRFSLDGSAKLALGWTHQEVTVFGNETVNGVVQQPQGGLLALNSNSGTRSRDRFSVVPEIGLRVGYAVNDWLRLTLGYNFLYWSSVARPGQQIDRNLDITRIPNFAPAGTPAVPGLHPAPLFNSSDLWVQGLTFGVELTF
jgi:hypothetical protein